MGRKCCGEKCNLRRLATTAAKRLTKKLYQKYRDVQCLHVIRIKPGNGSEFVSYFCKKHLISHINLHRKYDGRN